MDDQFDFGSYNPSVGANSRSGSMKKLTRKTDKSPLPNDKKSTKKQDLDYLDDLLNDDLKPKKKDTSVNKNTSTSQPKKNVNDTLDSFFDEPSTNLNITSKISQKTKPTQTNMDFARTSINYKPQKKLQSDIISEDHDYLPNFSKPRDRSKSPTNQQIKLPEDHFGGLQSHTSMRNMRPPMKRKQSQSNLSKNQSSNLTVGLKLNEEKKESSKLQFKNLTLNLGNEEDFKPERSVNLARRGSMDSKSEKKFQTGLTIPDEQNLKKETQVSHFNIFDRKEPSVLKIDSPKGKSQISQMKIGESIMINQKHSHFYNQNVSLLRDVHKKPEDVIPQVKESNKSIQRPHVRLVQPPRLSNSSNIMEEERKNFNDYQKQVEHLKQTYQKQMGYLQQSLDKQIKINQQTRERLINESNHLIEEQRRRWTRINDQQVKRLKEMNEWQKKKMEQSYKFEVQNLKATISQYQSSNANLGTITQNQFQTQSSNNKYKKEIQHLSQQLQLQKKLLIDRQNFLTKRELQLEEREQDFNSKKRKQEGYYREQEKLLFDKENKLKNNILNQKKTVMDDKQKIAMDAANMELDIIKRKEKLDLLIKQAEMEKQSIENERHQIRSLNQQMMARYKQKMNELMQDKERVSSLQADLIRKLRIIELKANQCDFPLNQASQNTGAKENNWVKERPHSTANQKKQKINETFQRYNKIEKAANNNKQSNGLNLMNKTLVEGSGKGFKLQDYMGAMNKNQKIRHNNFI